MSVTDPDISSLPFELSRSAFRLLSRDEQKVVVRLIRAGRIKLVDRRPANQLRGPTEAIRL